MIKGSVRSDASLNLSINGRWTKKQGMAESNIFKTSFGL
jgi:hypothetical protein